MGGLSREPCLGGRCPLFTACPLTSLEGPSLQPELGEGRPGVVECRASHGGRVCEHVSEQRMTKAIGWEYLPGRGCQQEGRRLSAGAARCIS